MPQAELRGAPSGLTTLRDRLRMIALRLPNLDFAAFDQRIHHLIEDRRRRPGGTGDAAGVQGHVILLNAVGGKRPQGGEVLRQTHRRHHFGKLRGRLHTKNLMVDAHTGVGFERAALGAHLHGDFDLALQIPRLVAAPLGQRGVAALAGGVGVGGGLDGPPVVAGGDGHSIDPVHDALVVGGGSVGVHQGKVAGQHDAVPHLFAAVVLALQVLHGNADAGLGDGPIGQVGEDAQEDLAAGDGLH